MKSLLVGIAVSLALASVAVAKPADPQLMAPINQFGDSFNKGDMKGAIAATTPGGMVIIDEVAPYAWSGPSAMQDWVTSLSATNAAEGLTDILVKLGEPTNVMVSGNHGYVVLPATLTFKAKGKPMHEAAQLTVSLLKGSGGWKMSGWAWTGNPPQPD